MEGDSRIDELMQPVRTAIERHVKDRSAIAEIYNRAYEAVMNSMDALDTSAKVTAKQIAENSKNLQRAKKADAENKELKARLKTAGYDVMEIITAALSGENVHYLSYNIGGIKYVRWDAVEKDIRAIFDEVDE